MRYIDLKAPGPPDVLFLNEGSKPALKPDEVLIEVKASGLNHADIFQRRGEYPPPKDASPILGMEVAGKIVEKGQKVTQWQIGDSVCALANGGGYAEFCAVPQTQCLPVPKPLNFVEAASLPEIYFTVWSNVFQRAKLSNGEILLVHAGASGIGSAAIQLGKAFGAKVIVTTSTHEKGKFCESLHADHVIFYHQEDFEKKAMELTQGRGVDVILDVVGGDYFQKNLQILALEGRLVQIATLQKSRVELNLMTMMQKRLVLTGSTLRPQSTDAKGKIADELRTKVWPLFASGKLKPTVTAVFPWEQNLRGAPPARIRQNIWQDCSRDLMIDRLPLALTPGRWT